MAAKTSGKKSVQDSSNNPDQGFAGLPMGLGMALAQNPEAMNRFAALSEEEKRQVIQHTHEIGSKKEMRSYVDSLFRD